MRIGRSTSTTPWSKSISITRSATMHSRPIETCWKAEIVHSWPSTDLAPMSTSPSCTRTLLPCPIHDQRPRCSLASRPIWSVTSGATKHSPSVYEPAAPAQLEPRPAQREPAVLEVEHPVVAREPPERPRPAVRGQGRRADERQLGGIRHRGHGRAVILVIHAPWRTTRPLPPGCWRATSARSPAPSRWSRTTTPRAGRSSARSTRTPAGRPSSASPARRAPASRRSSARSSATSARSTARSPCCRSIPARRSGAARCSATGSG